MRHRACVPTFGFMLSLCVAASGCLERPALFARDADPGDSPEEPSFEVQSIDVFDARGAPRSVDAMPRRPRVRVTLSHPPADAEAFFLVAAAPDESADGAIFDEEIRADLESAPLRASTEAALVDHDSEVDATQVWLTPVGTLAPGARFVLGVAKWAEDALGRRLAAPFLASLRVDASTRAGARVVQAWPPDAASGIGVGLPMAALLLDGEVGELPEDGVWLEDEGGRVVPSRISRVPCEEIGWVGPECLLLVPERPLAPSARHVLRAAGLIDATGAALEPFASSFSTASGDDEEPATFLPVACALDEDPAEVGCVFADDSHVELTVRASEPVRLRARALAREYRSVAPRGESRLRLGPFAAGRVIELELVATDTAGLERRVLLSLSTTESLAPLSITEVRSDPHGAEPAQEYVEVFNSGSTAIDLDGFALADESMRVGDVVMGHVMLAARGRALFVSDSFDAAKSAGGRDTPIPAGVPLVRVGTSLGSGGLSNSGEELFLRDALGRRLSAAPALATGAGRCLVRISESPREGSEEAFAIGECTPGR